MVAYEQSCRAGGSLRMVAPWERSAGLWSGLWQVWWLPRRRSCLGSFLSCRAAGSPLSWQAWVCLDKSVFLLDINAADMGIPLSALIDREFGDRQDAFRQRVQDSGLLTQTFADPATLGRLVERSLRELADFSSGGEKDPGKEPLRDV